MARRDGRDPANEMRAVMVVVGWGGSGKGDLTADAMFRPAGGAEVIALTQE
jgi:hypothetical protein